MKVDVVSVLLVVALVLGVAAVLVDQVSWM